MILFARAKFSALLDDLHGSKASKKSKEEELKEVEIVFESGLKVQRFDLLKEKFSIRQSTMLGSRRGNLQEVPSQEGNERQQGINLGGTFEVAIFFSCGFLGSIDYHIIVLQKKSRSKKRKEKKDKARSKGTARPVGRGA